MRFFICTTTFEPNTRYLRETIYSILSQAGDFSLHYHIQDSSLNSVSALQLYQEYTKELVKPYSPLQCRAIHFSYHHQTDSGMYEGLNNGFSHILPSKDTDYDFMLYINADDILADLSLFKLERFIKANRPDFCAGKICHIGHNGEGLLEIKSDLIFSRVYNKEYNGESPLGFVPQESCAWRVGLWKSCGGFNPEYKLAGDFDLWPRLLRFSSMAKCYNCDFRIGLFRMHDLQLSRRRFNEYMQEVHKCKAC